MYGPNSSALRAELAALLRHHRIQHRLADAATFADASTTTDRQDQGLRIRRYRQSVLVWCRQAVTATSRSRFHDGPTADRDIAGELVHRLRLTIAASTAVLPTLDELTEPVGNPLVDTWRRAARAASLGEHDFHSGVDFGHLTDGQCVTVIQDAATVVRALISLDRRYRLIPSWEPLTAPYRLLHAADDCALLQLEHDLDHTVDQQGWRPRAQTTRGTLPPGVAGAIEGAGNILIALADFPAVHHLRIVMESQRIVSTAAADAVAALDPARATAWRARARAFHTLVVATRDLAGDLGNGRTAAGHASALAHHARTLAAAPIVDVTHAERLDQVFAAVEGRLRQIIIDGARAHLYFVRVPLPQIDPTSSSLVKLRQEEFVPLTSQVHAELLTTVRQVLRRPTNPHRPRRTTSDRSRREISDALNADHRRPRAIGL